jgi:uncharacterized protein YggE
MHLSRASVSTAHAVVFGLTANSQTINPDNKTIAISTTDEATAIAEIAAITVGFEIFSPDSESTYAHAGKL